MSTFLESMMYTQKWGILQTKTDQGRDHMKMNFDYFQIEKWILQSDS